MLRRLVALARSANTREISNLTDLGCFAGKEQRRYLSELPKEYQGYYQRQLLQPKRPPRASPVPAEEAAAASEDASTSSREDSPADVQLQSAQAGDFLRCAFTSPLIPACIPKPPTSQEQTEYEGPAQVITLSGLAKCNMSELPLLLTNIYTVCALIDAHASLQILSYTSTKRLLFLQRAHGCFHGRSGRWTARSSRYARGRSCTGASLSPHWPAYSSHASSYRKSPSPR